MFEQVYSGFNEKDGPSAAIWASMPQEVMHNPNVGYGLFDDFVTMPMSGTITTTISMPGGMVAFGSAGATITPDDALGGGIVLSETTDDESVAITYEQHPFWISQDYGMLCFEARIKASHTATTESAIFCGLMDTTALAAAVPLTATAGALADANLVGWHKLDTDLTSLKSVYKANGVTAVTVETCTLAITAATYVKLGFKFDPRDNYLRFYIDGEEQDEKKLIPNATGTDFPADIGLAPCLAMHLGAAASDNTLTMDWWACYQLRT